MDIHALRSEEELRRELAEDVRRGLTSRPKELSPKYLYDEQGSELFDRITELPEYYLARAETEILQRHAAEIVREADPDDVIEIGGGFSRKTELFLAPLSARGRGRYVSLDVSKDALVAAAERLSQRFPALEFAGVIGDFVRDLARIPRTGRRLVLFLGSTLGNHGQAGRARFLSGIRDMLAPDDRFVLGVDLVKSVERLEAAYDDSQRVTAEFILNVLRVLNRELEGELPVEAFRYVASWAPEAERMEMHLTARRAVRARLGALDLEVRFEAGEALRVEVSSKFRRAGIEDELARAGLTLRRWLEDSAGDFALVVAGPA